MTASTISEEICRAPSSVAISRKPRLSVVRIATFGRLLRPWVFQRRVETRHASGAQLDDATRHGTRDVTHFLPERAVCVESLVARRVRLVVTDETIETRVESGIDQSHPVEPVAKCPPGRFDALDIAMHHDAVNAIGQMLRIVPAFELDLLRFLGVLSRGSR